MNTFFDQIVFLDYCFPFSTIIFLFWIVVGKVFSEYICDNSVNDFPCVSGKIIVATTQTITQTALCIQNTPDIPIKLAHAGKILTLINIIINLNEFVQKWYKCWLYYYSKDVGILYYCSNMNFLLQSHDNCCCHTFDF